MKNVFEAVVESCERRDSYAWLRIGKGRLAARLWPGIEKGQSVRASVRPEDVVLCAGHPGTTSARNVLPGHVRRTRYVPEGVEVEMDVGFPLVALITRRAGKELGLRRDRGMFALVKATAVLPVVELARGAVRVSLIGPGGSVDPSKIDLLRAVEREGSLSRAAEALGMAYRTAWLWARDMNRAWGKPLLARSRGGRGGGGTLLTAEGGAAIRRAAQVEKSFSLTARD